MTKHLYIHTPTVICTGTINASFNGIYPLLEIPILVSTGDTQDIKAGMTVIFGSTAGAVDLGRQRIRTDHGLNSTMLDIAYTSQGRLDGEIDISPGDYFTVLDDRRVWPRHQRFFKQNVEPFVTIYKDGNIPFESIYTQGNGDPPKANAGPPRAGTINTATGVLTVSFDATASYSVPGGTGIASYLWNFKDGTITVGTSTSATATVTFPAGFRYISLTVTDNDNITHRVEIPVYARDPANDTCVDVWIADLNRTQEGQTLSVQVFSDLPRSTYPDGTVVIMFDENNGPNHYTDFYGWIHTDPQRLEFVRTGALRDTRLECFDLADMLGLIPGQSLYVEHKYTAHSLDVTVAANAGDNIVIVAPIPIALRVGDILRKNTVSGTIFTMTSNAAEGATALGINNIPEGLTVDDILIYEQFPTKWGEFYHPDIYRVIDYIFRWHSTAFELADFLLPSVDAGIHHRVYTREISASTVFAQAQEIAHSIGHDHNIGVNRPGQLVCRIDPMLQDGFHRTATVQGTLNGHIRSINITHNRFPRYQWLRGGAILEGWEPTPQLIQVSYSIRPSGESFEGATSVSVFPTPVALPDNAVVYRVGLEGQLLPWFTVNGATAAGATSIPVDPLENQVDQWTKLQYTATENGPAELTTVFCIAPGEIPGLGADAQTINGKIVENGAELENMIGNLWARLNSEWGIFDIELADEDLEYIDPVEMTWVTATNLESKYLPQRQVQYFSAAPARFLPIDVRISYTSDIQGSITSISLRLERETEGISAVSISADDI